MLKMYTKYLEKTKKLIDSSKKKVSNMFTELKESSTNLTEKLISYIKFVAISNEEKTMAMVMIKPGDILLVRTPTFVHSKLRMLSNTSYDHCVVILDSDLNWLQITFPRAKLWKAWPFVVADRDPIIIRPKVSDEVRKAFIEQAKTIVGKRYDLYRLISLVFRRKQPFMTLDDVTPQSKSFFDYFRIQKSVSQGENDRVICSHSIFEAFWKANPDFKIPFTEKGYLDYSRNGSFSVDDFNRVALLQPEQFEIINYARIWRSLSRDNSLEEQVENEIKQLSVTAVVESDSTSFMEKYGIVHLVNLILFIHEKADIINIILKTIEVLSLFLDKSENIAQRQNIIYTITSYIKLIRIFADIEEHALNKSNGNQLHLSLNIFKYVSMALLRMFVFNPNSKKMKLINRIGIRILLSDKAHSIFSSIYTKAKNKMKAKI